MANSYSPGVTPSALFFVPLFAQTLSVITLMLLRQALPQLFLGPAGLQPPPLRPESQAILLSILVIDRFCNSLENFVESHALVYGEGTGLFGRLLGLVIFVHGSCQQKRSCRSSGTLVTDVPKGITRRGGGSILVTLDRSMAAFLSAFIAVLSEVLLFVKGITDGLTFIIIKGSKMFSVFEG
jgi:hypothetical protein